MATQKKQSKGTGNLVAGAGITAYGAAHAPILRSGHKDMSRMTGASPKQEGSRYQAELHRAMQAGNVSSDSSVHVLRTPSGRHINAGGTHRHIARQAMGQPSQYKVKNISHEVHISPAQHATGRLQLAGLRRGSKAAQAGKTTKPVSSEARAANRVKAAAADVADAKIWNNPSMIKPAVQMGRKAGLIHAGTIAGTGALLGAAGLHERHEWKKKHPVSKMSDAQLRRRQKAQGHVARTTSTL